MKVILSVLWLVATLVTATAWYDDEMMETILMYCGRDENGTVIREPSEDFCEHPRSMYESRPGRGYGIGTVFRGGPVSFGPIYGYCCYDQIAPVPLGFGCDGVLLIDSMYKIMRDTDGDTLRQATAEQAEQDGRYRFGRSRPSSVGMRCLVEPLVEFENSSTVYAALHGKVSGCTICEESIPFDCPTEFEQWYIDSELMYRDGNICDEIFGDRNDTVWFPYIEYYYGAAISIYVAYHGNVAELGRNHPFMPGHNCPEGDCPCSMLPVDSPVYPDSLFGGENPSWSLPVTLHGYPYHSRTLGQRLSGTCDEPAIVQAVFKLSADASWNDINTTFVEYGKLNRTETVHLNELRKDVLSPGIYTNGTWPLTPKMSGLMNGRLLSYKLDDVTLIRCLIEPNDDFKTEEERYTHGAPYGCISCVQLSPCAAPQLNDNMTTEWILDTITGFMPLAYIPGITVPPGYELTLAAYNATSDTPEARSNLPVSVRNASGILFSDGCPMWSSFTY